MPTKSEKSPRKAQNVVRRKPPRRPEPVPEDEAARKLREYTAERDRILSTGTPSMMLRFLDEHDRAMANNLRNTGTAERVFHHARVINTNLARDLRLASWDHMHKQGWQIALKRDEIE